MLKIIQDLQCFKCKKVPRPYGNQSKRYLCEKSHSLCVRHKEYKVEDNYFWLERFEKKCPCGSLVQKKSSQSIAKKLQNLPWMCQNYQWGCREVKVNAKSLETHHGECLFRKVICPLDVQYGIPVCSGKNKVCFKDIFDHMNTDHKNTWYEIEMDRQPNKWTDMINIGEGELKSHSGWAPSKLTSTNGDVFGLVATVSWYSALTYFITYLLTEQDVFFQIHLNNRVANFSRFLVHYINMCIFKYCI